MPRVLAQLEKTSPRITRKKAKRYKRRAQERGYEKSHVKGEWRRRAKEKGAGGTDQAKRRYGPGGTEQARRQYEGSDVHEQLRRRAKGDSVGGGGWRQGPSKEAVRRITCA